MDEFARQDAPYVAAEKETLVAFLDYFRATILLKMDGVSDEDLRRKLTASGLTLLGLVKHLAHVERYWFQLTFAGHDIKFPWTDADPNADWRIEPDESTETIIELYKEAIRQARLIVEAASFEDVAKKARDTISLRWIVTHMVEETARHAGHADILRENIDGVIGD